MLRRNNAQFQWRIAKSARIENELKNEELPRVHELKKEELPRMHELRTNKFYISIEHCSLSIAH